MAIRFPLYAKVLLWLFLNLAGLSLAFYVVFKAQFRLGLDSLLMGRAGDRLQAVAEVVAAELSDSPRQSWNEVLKRFSDAYRVQFHLYRNDGLQLAGGSLQLPPPIAEKLGRGPLPARLGPQGPRGPALGGRGPPLDRLGPPGLGPGAVGMPARQGPHPKFMDRTTHPTRYWVGVRFPLWDPDARRLLPVTLLAVSESFGGGGLFFDFTPWVAVGFAAVFLSVLFWLPLVRGITRSISQMTRATEQIAEGRFDVRLTEKRYDELGSLAQAINRMAARLAGFIAGQKRLLGDVAHELCSPLARIQVALGILEQRANEKQAADVNDVREEVQQMSSLVNELLSFSKAGLRAKEIQLTPVNLAAAVRQVLEREAKDAGQIETRIEESLVAQAEPELLSRAVANLVRNAIRYAAGSGPISISAVRHQDRIRLTVADSGPGVPEEALAQLFDPFFRVEPSRSRETGGIGLGLAIVRTCVEACQGIVAVRNRQPSGLEVELTLRASAENRPTS
jgi:two-component system sensor histidine kinase CpxA